MSVLTKIFIVLLAVFSIAFAMSTISFVAQSNNWRQLATDYRAAHELVETKMVNLSAAHAAEKGNWLDVHRDDLRRLSDREGELQAAQGELTAIQAELVQVQQEKSSADALVQNLTGQLKLASAARDQEQKQRETLQARNIELEKRNLDLSERVNELTHQTLVMVEQQRQFEQQINILRSENEKLSAVRRRGGTGMLEEGVMGRVTPVEPVAATPIRGHILQVEGNLATISVGSADGVEPNMTFVIFRGDEYIGDLRISDVEPHMSAGTIVRFRTAPRVDDLVADEAGFGRAG